MNLHNDLLKEKIPHSCKDCCRKCAHRTEACEAFYPSNMRDFLNNSIYVLRGTVTPSIDKKLKRHPLKTRAYDDGVTTLDEYYVQLINSVLSEIRKGHCDYVFNFGQIKEIMRFEPDIKVTYIAEAESYKIEKVKREVI